MPRSHRLGFSSRRAGPSRYPQGVQAVFARAWQGSRSVRCRSDFIGVYRHTRFFLGGIRPCCRFSIRLAERRGGAAFSTRHGRRAQASRHRVEGGRFFRPPVPKARSRRDFGQGCTRFRRTDRRGRLPAGCRKLWSCFALHQVQALGISARAYAG